MPSGSLHIGLPRKYTVSPEREAQVPRAWHFQWFSFCAIDFVFHHILFHFIIFNKAASGPPMSLGPHTAQRVLGSPTHGCDRLMDRLEWGAKPAPFSSALSSTGFWFLDLGVLFVSNFYSICFNHNKRPFLQLPSPSPAPVCSRSHRLHPFSESMC